MSEQHPQSLLILDDVWEVETARAFAARCRTLVTSRYAAVVEEDSGTPVAQHVHKVSIIEKDDSKELMVRLL